MKFGEFLQVMITQILKKKSMLGSHHQRRFQSVKHLKKKSSSSLTMNLEPLIEFFRTTLSQPDSFIYAH